MRLTGTIMWLVPSALLLAGGLVHILTRQRLVSTLREQRLLPASFIPAAAGVLAAIEIATGAVALWANAVVSSPSIARLALVAVAGVYAAFSTYLWILATRRPGSACGCLGDTRPANGWAVGRAVVLSSSSLVAAGAAPSPPLDGSMFESALTLLIGASISFLVWALPGALHDPMAEARRSGLEVSP